MIQTKEKKKRKYLKASGITLLVFSLLCSDNSFHISKLQYAALLVFHWVFVREQHQPQDAWRSAIFMGDKLDCRF